MCGKNGVQIYHLADECLEFIISSPPTSVKKTILSTVGIAAVSFILNLHTQDHIFLTVLLGALVLIWLLKLHFKVKQESLLVMSALGVQLTTTFASGRQLSQFYPHSHIKDIVINEAVTMQKVIFYLCLLLHDQTSTPTSKVVPLFTHSWPRLCCLEKIYKSLPHEDNSSSPTTQTCTL